jgi:hypothetical protein
MRRKPLIAGVRSKRFRVIGDRAVAQQCSQLRSHQVHPEQRRARGL